MQRLKRLEYRGVNVGQHVLSTPLTQSFPGSVTLDDPQAQAVVERLLPESMALALAAERVLDELRPDVVLFNEARYAGYGPLFETGLKRGLNVIQFVHAFSDDAFVFKRYTAATSRVHPRSLGDSAWSEVKAGPWHRVMESELSAQFDLRYAGKDLLSRRLHEHTRRRGRDELVASRSRPVQAERRPLLAHPLGREPLLRRRPLRGPGGVADRDDPQRGGQSAPQLDRQAPPGQRLEAQARGTDGRAPGAGGDPVEARRAAAARPAAAAGHGREYALALRAR